MNAATVIEEIKRLSGPEKLEVYTFVTEQLAGGTTAAGPAKEKITALSFKEAQDRVFQEHRDLFRRLAQ